jgi:hypothetical protein
MVLDSRREIANENVLPRARLDATRVEQVPVEPVHLPYRALHHSNHLAPPLLAGHRSVLRLPGHFTRLIAVTDTNVQWCSRSRVG